MEISRNTMRIPLVILSGTLLNLCLSVVALWMSSGGTAASESLAALISLPGFIRVIVLAVLLSQVLMEEWVFRQWIYEWARNTWNERVALHFSSVLFASAHLILSPTEALLLLPLSYWLGFLRQKSGTVFLPILCHFGFNLPFFLRMLWGA